MASASWFPLVASAVLALIPVFVWLRIVTKEGEEKSLYVKTFLFGTFSVVPPFILILLFEQYPKLNIYSIITRDIHEVALAAFLTNIVVGIVEEIAKNVIVRIIDKRHPEYIQTIGAALKLSICAGLGFSFAENIFYFYNIWVSPEYGTADLFTTFVFRSVFTMCGHMVFSGIFGYYFGIGKFSADLTEVSRWEGEKMRFARALSRLSGKMTFEVVRELKNLKGLLIAIGMHASFNASLDLQHKLPSLLIVIFGALYVLHLLQTKSGHLLFSMAKRRGSTMAPKDEDVVIELLGMWSKEGRYREVAEICDRLLTRDPDNNVVKMFKAKAGDKQELRQFYDALKGVLGKGGGVRVEGGVSPTSSAPQPGMNIQDEKVVIEVMQKWYGEGNYNQVLDVANKLLARNPNSEGARVLLEKSMDKEKIDKVFDTLSRLFKE